ncbi:diguanylate cyclase (GGDEF)-like protein [Trinickia symbiotica]|nr:GGDEF domain-containing protein [Trinickia symbiotica]PPK43301.1 diguanylate cyclase (GGDEF)-like protein [Trinickia symbiotica]
MAIASLLALLTGLLFLAVQARAIFSDELKQEYVALVVEAVGRAQAAAVAASETKRTFDLDQTAADDYRRAQANLVARVKRLAALEDASPFASPHVTGAALSPDAVASDTDASLDAASTYWHAQRDRTAADLRMRISGVANALIVLSAFVFSALITALVMYSKRARQLAEQSSLFQHAALHDALTGLPNRRKLFEVIEEAAAATSTDPPGKIAILYIDLDGFKAINDSRGHRAGDEFLIGTSRRFRRAVRVGDVVARIGGDEFAVLIREYSSDAQLASIARRLSACVEQTAEEMGLRGVSASIGIACWPDSVKDLYRLVAAADETMYQVKRTRKSGYAFAAPANR